ncbi:MAG: amidohydrolase family protein [Chloroflexota bacterium]|nr:amidohydrolase family protein [Chloroflexota bacterium]
MAPITVTADRIWAADGGGVQHNAFVQYEGDTITTIGNQADLPTGDTHGESIALGDVTLMPGLINCHCHLTLSSGANVLADYFSMSDELFMALAIKHAKEALAAGVTTLRDCGTKNNIVFSVRKAQEMGLIESPRIWASGACLTSTGGHCYFFGVEVDGETEIKRAVRAQVKAGADFIKVMATGGGITPGTNPRREQFSPEEMVTLVNDAHRLNKRVSAHCHGTPGVRNATMAGVDTIEHCSFMVEEAPGIRYEPEIVVQIAERGIYVVPTTSVGYRMLERVLRGDIPRTPQYEGFIANQQTRMENIGRLVTQGVRIASGSDAGVGGTYFDDFALDVELLVTTAAGFTPEAALYTATATAADALGRDDLGVLAPGKKADMIAVHGNPLEDIHALRKVAMVMQGGRKYVG